jgi:hypothetical protein
MNERHESFYELDKESGIVLAFFISVTSTCTVTIHNKEAGDEPGRRSR